MSWESKVKNWDGKLYKVLKGNKSCHGGNFEWSLPKGDKPGDWTPIIENVEMCKRGYHLTTHYAHWSSKDNIFVYEAEGDVVKFDGYDKVVCSRARLLRLVENLFPKDNTGKNNSGWYNSGNGNSGNRNSGNHNSGSFNSGDKNSGSYNSGWCNFGSCNIGDFNTGRRNSGNYNTGYNNVGNYNTGYNNVGNYNTGYNNVGSYNTGNYNSGNWNSGDRNSGYFCEDLLPIRIFGKLAPENWKPKFPEWMYFDLLPEGHHASWQKAFEKADIRGIRELLALPNFDYEIFERITSITKEQIEEKLKEI